MVDKAVPCEKKFLTIIKLVFTGKLIIPPTCVTVDFHAGYSAPMAVLNTLFIAKISPRDTNVMLLVGNTNDGFSAAYYINTCNNQMYNSWGEYVVAVFTMAGSFQLLYNVIKWAHNHGGSTSKCVCMHDLRCDVAHENPGRHSCGEDKRAIRYTYYVISYVRMMNQLTKLWYAYEHDMNEWYEPGRLYTMTHACAANGMEIISGVVNLLLLAIVSNPTLAQGGSWDIQICCSRRSLRLSHQTTPPIYAQLNIIFNGATNNMSVYRREIDFIAS